MKVPVEVYAGQEAADAARSVCYMGCSREQLQQLTATLERNIAASAGAGSQHTVQLALPLGSPPRATLRLSSLDGVYAALYRFCLTHKCTPQEFQSLVERVHGDVEGIADPRRGFRRAGLHAHTDKVFHHGYERSHGLWLARYRFAPVRLLEIGYLEGASSALWREYFPRAERVTFLDLNAPAHCQVPRQACPVSGGHPTHQLYHMDSGDRVALKALTQAEAPHDIIVDDGGHTTAQQLSAFEVLFVAGLKPGGVYIIEDIETSFWANAPKGTTTVDFFLRAARGLNRFFFDRRQEPEMGVAAAGLIESVTMGHNCIVITKARPQDAQFTRMPYRFHHMVKGYKP